MIIIVAEDEGITRLWMKTLIQSWGYEVVDFANGPDALHYLQSLNRSYVAILDWVLPGIDGIAICQQLKADAGKRVLGFLIMLSGQSSPSDQLRAKSQGADDFVAKPFEAEDLHQKIRLGISELELRGG